MSAPRCENCNPAVCELFFENARSAADDVARIATNLAEEFANQPTIAGDVIDLNHESNVEVTGDLQDFLGIIGCTLTKAEITERFNLMQVSPRGH